MQAAAMKTIETCGSPGLADAGWRAQLDLKFAAREGFTWLASRRHTGPLLVQRPFYPEGPVCHTYIVHPPGGIVAGDQLQITVEAAPGAHAVITTPAATKFYRSHGPRAYQNQCLNLHDASMEWLPQETIFYRGACAHTGTRVELDRQSKFIGWEVFCLGLPARREPFDAGTLHLDLELWVEGRPRFIDRLRVTGESRSRTARWGFGGHEAVGTMLVYPAQRAMLEALRKAAALDDSVSITAVDDVIVCRCLAAQGEQVRTSFVRLWQTARPLLLGLPAVMPRIWAT
ncbi:MAG TPA: urease accessory protein UreD [Steroidobacteraceae bacterium]